MNNQKLYEKACELIPELNLNNMIIDPASRHFYSDQEINIAKANLREIKPLINNIPEHIIKQAQQSLYEEAHDL